MATQNAKKNKTLVQTTLESALQAKTGVPASAPVKPATKHKPAARKKVPAKAQSGSPAPDAGEVLSLTLALKDPDVVAILRGLESPEREDHARKALRLGLLTLRMAQGEIDTRAVRKEGEHLLSRLSEFMHAQQGQIVSGMNEELRRYFDPETGILEQRVERLVNKDNGELVSVLGSVFGDKDSFAHKLLAEFMGENSHIVRLLDPENTGSIKHQLTQTMEGAVGELHTKLLGEFSLDNEESALSRCIGKLEDQNGALQEELQENIEALAEQFSLDDEDSALSRMMYRWQQAQSEMQAMFSLDSEDSVLARMRKELMTEVKELREIVELVRQSVAAKEGREAAEAAGVQHGHTFEQRVGEELQALADSSGDVFENVGERVGKIKNCKVGDHLLTMGPEHIAAGRKVVFESKEKKNTTDRAAIDELAKARKNRDADVGVFIFSHRTAPSNELLRRRGQDILVVWDSEEPSARVVLQAAFLLSRHMLTQAGKTTPDVDVDFDAIDRAIHAVNKQAERMDEIRKQAQAQVSSAEKILKHTDAIQKDLLRQVDRLSSSMEAVRDLV